MRSSRGGNRGRVHPLRVAIGKVKPGRISPMRAAHGHGPTGRGKKRMGSRY